MEPLGAIESDRTVIMAFMDSGNVVQFECDTFEITRYPERDELGTPLKNAYNVSGYRWEADSRHPVQYKLIELNVDKVEAIVEIRPLSSVRGTDVRSTDVRSTDVRSTDVREIERETRELYTRSRDADRTGDSQEARGEGEEAGGRVQGD